VPGSPRRIELRVHGIGGANVVLHAISSSRVRLLGVLLDLAQQLVQRGTSRSCRPIEGGDDPLLMGVGHFGELPCGPWRSGARGRRGGRRQHRPAPPAPSPTSWSVMPVTLPPVTIMRRDSSFIFRPFGARSSWAIRSKRGSVVSNCSRAAGCAHLLFDQLRAGQHAQPQAQCLGVFAVYGSGFHVHGQAVPFALARDARLVCVFQAACQPGRHVRLMQRKLLLPCNLTVQLVAAAQVGRGQSTARLCSLAASCSVQAGSARCGRAMAHRSARPAR
jgi:hypothetical protein